MDTAKTGELYGAGAAVLIISLALGIVALWSEKCRHQDSHSADLFFTGNRRLRTVPMTLSLIATLVTPVSWVALPVAVASYGVTPALALSIGLIVSAPFIVVLFLPVFFNTQPVTAFEYLEQRFGRSVKLLASGLFVCYTITVLPAMLYIPMSAIKKVTGIPIEYAGPVVLVVALAYTVIGGMKAVQWASSFHIIVASISLVCVIVFGSKGGAWRHVTNPQVLDVSRGWGSGLGMSFWLSAQLACGQPQVQRYLSVPLLAQSRIAILITAFTVCLLVLMQAVSGILMSNYNNQVPYTDEYSLNYYEQFIEYSFAAVSNVPGLSGLIVAALCSLALSSIASGVHALSAVLTMDVFRSRNARHWHELSVMRGRLVVAASCLLILVAYAVMVFFSKPLIIVALTFPRITGGTLFGLFCLGVLIPWANTAGALTGAAISLVIVWCASLGTRILSLVINMPREEIVPTGLLAPLGCAITLVLGSIISAVACPRNPLFLDPDLIAPVVRWLHRKIRGVAIGAKFEDSTVQDDFQYEAIPLTSRANRRAAGYAQYARGGARLHVQRRLEQLQGENWPDIAYPHLRRQQRERPQRPLSGLAWDSNTGELYLEPPRTLSLPRSDQQNK